MLKLASGKSTRSTTDGLDWGAKSKLSMWKSTPGGYWAYGYLLNGMDEATVAVFREQNPDVWEWMEVVGIYSLINSVPLSRG